MKQKKLTEKKLTEISKIISISETLIRKKLRSEKTENKKGKGGTL